MDPRLPEDPGVHSPALLKHELMMNTLCCPGLIPAGAG